MAAKRHLFTDDPLPSVIVLDSSLVFEALIDSGSGRHQPARSFCRRLQTENTPVIYSSLMFLEAPQCWKRFYRRGALVPKQPSFDPVLNRENAFREADLELERFLSNFNRQRINITRDLMRLGSKIAARYGMDSHDALVVALLEEFGLSDLGVIDDHFLKIDHLELWDGMLIK